MGAAPQAAAASMPSRVVLALVAATFVISASFGLNMPLLPALIEAVSPSAAARVPLHAGLLGALFTLALTTETLERAVAAAIASETSRPKTR